MLLDKWPNLISEFRLDFMSRPERAINGLMMQKQTGHQNGTLAVNGFDVVLTLDVH